MVDTILNSDILVDYYIEAEECWYLGSEQHPFENREILIKKLFSSLATNDRVRYIKLCGHPKFTTEELDLFIDSLQMNRSVVYLEFKTSSPDEDEAAEQNLVRNLFTSLSRREISLKSLNVIAWVDCSEPGLLASLLVMIQANPELESLSLNVNMNDETVFAVMQQMAQSCHKLKYLYIGTNCGLDGFYAIARFAGQSRTLERVGYAFDEDLSEEAVVEAEGLLGTENTSLVHFGLKSYNGRDDNRPQCAHVRKNQARIEEEKRQKNIKEYMARREYEKKFERCVPEANYDLTKFPVELVFSLLVHTGIISTMAAFFKTCKYWRAFSKKYQFWRRLVSVMPVIEPEVFECTDVFYSEHLIKYGAESSNYWDILVKKAFAFNNFPMLRYWSVDLTDKTSKSLPFHQPPPSPLIHEQLLTALYRRYPRLLACTKEFSVDHNPKAEISMESPYMFLQLTFSSIFHVIVQTFGNQRITAFFFIGTQWSAPRPMDYIEQPLEFIVATNVDEALVKMKRMMDTFATVIGRRSMTSQTIDYSTAIMLKRAKELHVNLQHQISSGIEAMAEKIMRRFELSVKDRDCVTTLAQSLSKKLRSQPLIVNNEFVDCKEKLPHRNTLHQLYPKGILRNFSFLTFNRDSVRGFAFDPPKGKPRKKSRNSALKGTIMKIIRMTMNAIIMPVLHALWPRHLSEVDSGTQGENFSLPEGILHYYIKNFQPLSSISIDNAAPSSWPLSGIVIASQIAEKVGQLIEDLVGIKSKKNDTSSVNIDAFIEYLRAYELIPPNYLICLKENLTLVIAENHD